MVTQRRGGKKCRGKPYIERDWYISRPGGQYLKLCSVEDGMTEAKLLIRQKLAELDAEREQMGGCRNRRA